MISLIVAGIVLIGLVAVVVGVVDARQAAGWRRIAAERREQWEARVLELHGVDERLDAEPDSWDDD
ncbi:MAG TPA: hypothetical protein VEZ42_01630 [Pseudonocardia sp.]|nr:hypothetical protein [Pseudonocardia sp.]